MRYLTVSVTEISYHEKKNDQGKRHHFPISFILLSIYRENLKTVKLCSYYDNYLLLKVNYLKFSKYSIFNQSPFNKKFLRFLCFNINFQSFFNWIVTIAKEIDQLHELDYSLPHSQQRENIYDTCGIRTHTPNILSTPIHAGYLFNIYLLKKKILRNIIDNIGKLAKSIFISG